MTKAEHQAAAWLLIQVVLQNSINDGAVRNYIERRGGTEQDSAAVERIIQRHVDRAVRNRASAQHATRTAPH